MVPSLGTLQGFLQVRQHLAGTKLYGDIFAATPLKGLAIDAAAERDHGPVAQRGLTLDGVPLGTLIA